MVYKIKLIIGHTVEKKGFIIETNDSSIIDGFLVEIEVKDDLWYKDIYGLLDEKRVKKFYEGKANLNLLEDIYKFGHGKDFNVFLLIEKSFIEDWKKEWGQTNNDIKDALLLEGDDSSVAEYVNATGFYFYHEKDSMWYCKNNAFFGKVDEFISKRIEENKQDFWLV